MTGLPRHRDQTLLASSSSRNANSRSGFSGRNVFSLLAQREISPRTKHVPKRHWGETSKSKPGSCSCSKNEVARDARSGLLSWVEAESLRHLSAKYCSLLPPPRSTIAAAFSPDGKVLASTHGDHTVKIIDCESGNCLKVLMGHRRTPWVVRFHPLHPEILASGSLDQEVRLWDANTSQCLYSHHFYRPIASIAFHAKGEILALYMWHYNKRGEASLPSYVLKTRRSLRAVHFHPHVAPYLLTAEVNDLDTSDSMMTQATSLGYLQYPPPAVFVTNIHSREHVNLSSEPPVMSPFFFTPSFTLDDSRMEIQQASHVLGSGSTQIESSTSLQFQADISATEQYNATVSSMDTSSEIPSSSQNNTECTAHATFSNGMGIGISNLTMDGMATDVTEPTEGSHQGNSTNVYSFSGALYGLSRRAGNQEVPSELGQFHQFFPSRDSSGWELPFLQGWLMGQSQVGVSSMLSHRGGGDSLAQQIGSSTMSSNMSTHNVEAAMPGSITIPGATVRSGLQNHFPHSHVPDSDYGNRTASSNNLHDGTDIQTIASRIQSELATSVAAAELPCTVKLRVWLHDIKNPCAPLGGDSCLLTIPHAVLCSEMGAHFSPCGRFLAACVACMVPHTEADSELQTLVHQEHGVATSPTRHPISATQVMYELRVYSLEKATFGSVLASRAIRAAHCLTSIQFSPTSEHILLAYGRRHGSLLKSIVIDGETTLPIYTVLEVYRVSDMELVRVLPSAEDEVNVACFHPFAGGGLVYGTKEGKLRVLQYDGAHAVNGTGPSYLPVESIVGTDDWVSEFNDLTAKMVARRDSPGFLSTMILRFELESAAMEEEEDEEIEKICSAWV
ncbi:Activating molecule in BECN1-regulated autophagy protein 1 [Senna tora]|uniref:Activating molecule in BECN1-regulated autophagy protein 1 n=1 Tax=Senna tora TaxID=362788 RepID=A0A834SL60_9FABA|nr:Activating molecule in BECN1-regulated autophagy protein 1 [Senna tora]